MYRIHIYIYIYIWGGGGGVQTWRFDPRVSRLKLRGNGASAFQTVIVSYIQEGWRIYQSPIERGKVLH